MKTLLILLQLLAIGAGVTALAAGDAHAGRPVPISGAHTL